MINMQAFRSLPFPSMISLLVYFIKSKKTDYVTMMRMDEKRLILHNGPHTLCAIWCSMSSR